MNLLESIQILNDEITLINNRIKFYNILNIITLILFILIIGIFLNRKVKEKLIQLNEEKESRINSFIKELSKLENRLKKKYSKIEKDDTYLVYYEKEEFLKEIIETSDIINNLYSKTYELEEIRKKLTSSNENINNLKQKVENYNDEFVKIRKNNYNNLFKTDYGELDDYQKEAIVRDDKHNLVVAGAGSGKTEVLIRRIAYLIKRKPDSIKENKILAVAFQNKAANEIKERLKSNFNVNVDVRTFHSLGRKILEDTGKKISLIFSGDNFDNDFNRFIKKQYEHKLKDKKFKTLILDYAKYFKDDEIEKQENDFEKKEDYIKYNKNLSFTSLNDVKVKSEFERNVMNFFLTHKLNDKDIKIKYEEKAPWMKYYNDKGQLIEPSPDFFFPEFDTYLECWALDKNNMVPNWFSGENSTFEYKKGMTLKRAKFREQDKYKLMEIKYGEYQKTNDFNKLLKDKFLKILKDKFPNVKFEISEIPYEELINKLWSECKASIDTLPLNIGRFITISKTYGLLPEKVQDRLNNESWSRKEKAFTKIALTLFEDYQEILVKEDKIDFADMINLAVKELKNNNQLYSNKFDQILIDEYQDVSYQRYLLINELLKKNKKCKLFVVGDDWQSIMGFAGSNLDYFINFSKYFEKAHRTDLINNYRSIKSIVDCGAHLIKENGDSQIKKKTIASNEGERKINIISSLHQEGYENQYYIQITKHCINDIKEKIDSGAKPNEILILGRIMSNKKLYNSLSEFARKKHIQFSESDREGINRIRKMSVHKSKGLQAKYVYILDVTKGLYGFPCELENPSIFNIATLNTFEEEKEERRLFYVALTRAKEELTIYTMKSKSSKFLKEIEKYSEVKLLPINYDIQDNKTLNDY